MSYDFSWMITPILEQLTTFNIDSTNKVVAAGLGGVIAGIVTTLFTTKEEDVDARLIRGLFELDNFPTSHSQLAARYREIIKLLGILTTWTSVSSFMLGSAVFFLIVKVFTISRIGTKRHLMGHEHRLCELETLAETLIEKQDEIFAEKYNELEQYFALKDQEFENMFDSKLQKFDEMSLKFTSQAAKHKTSIKKEVERFIKEKESVQMLVDSTEMKLKIFQEQRDNLEKSIKNLKKEIDSRYKEITDSTRTLNTQINKYSDKIEKESLELDKDRDLLKVQIYKSNIQLINSEILFDASLSKFELINHKMNTLITGNSDSFETETFLDTQGRLEECLKKALKTRKIVELVSMGHCKEASNLTSTESTNLSLVIPNLQSEWDNQFSCEDDNNLVSASFKVYSNSTDLVLVDFKDRIELLESKVRVQSELIKNNKTMYSQMKDFTVKEIKEFKNKNEEWICNWFSVLYGLFNSDVTQLQSQLIGLDHLNSLVSLEETGNFIKDDVTFMESFVIRCKETCLKLLRELSLLLFEFYLLKSNDSNQGDVLQESEQRINETVKSIFIEFRQSVQRSGLSSEDAIDLSTIFLAFEEKLKKDLLLVVTNFSLVFKQNVDDFYIVFEASRQLNQQWNKDGTSKKTSNDSDDSVSVHFKQDSSCFDNDSTGDTSWGFDSDTTSDQESSIYKPLRLVQKRTPS